MKKGFTVTIILLCLFCVGYTQWQKHISQTAKEQTLFKKSRQFTGITKPRSTFKIHRSYDKDHSNTKLRLVVEVIGPYAYYEYKWILPSTVNRIAGEVEGTQDASTTKVFTHEIEFSSLKEGEKLIFDVVTYENDIKLSASYVYLHESLSQEDIENKIQSFKKSKELQDANLKIMQ